MASTPNFLLTPQQQELLFAALNANRPAGTPTTTAPNTLTMSPSSLTTSPAASKPADLSTIGFNDSSFLDYDYSFDGADSGLEFSINNGDTSLLDGADDDAGNNDDLKTESGGSADNDSPEKRGHPDDDDDETSGAKRRESTEKVPKKPGRKPLTSEPSSKRKAQNRAAQRAFRERKEKHLKDLETKVAELEKASETANSENGLLRAQVEKMTVELNEYKKRLALVSNTRSTPAPLNGRKTFGDAIFSNINDVNFQFEFPKFGQLPGPASTTPTSGLSASPSVHRSSSLDNAITPRTEMSGSTPGTASNKNSPLDLTSLEPVQKTKTTKDDLSKLSNVFTPPLTNNSILNTRTSMDSTATSSPSASSITNTAPSSSCGTSPEPCNNQSPMGFKPLDTMTTIGEEPSTTTVANANTSQDFSHFANVDINDMSWLGSNNFRFDPQLFGDYREPQENILSSGGFDDSFFNDALDIDFTTPFNTAPSPILHKNSLIAQIDAAKDAGEIESATVNNKNMPPIPQAHSGTLLTCNKIWERLQTCPKVQNGDFDLDGLCSDLQKKAKCSGSGAVVDEHDFKIVMKKYLGKDGETPCVDELATAVTAKK